MGLLALTGCDLGAPPTDYPGVGTATVTGDLDGDGHLDVLTRVRPDGADVLLGDGTGAFTVGSMPGTFGSAQLHRMMLADANGDGLDDLFALWRDPPTPAVPAPPLLYRLHLNEGAAGFGSGTIIHSIPTDGDFFFVTPWAVHDIDGDGDEDLVLTHATTAIVRLGDGAGGFGAPVSSASSILALSPLQFADLDADGHDDLVVPGAASPAQPTAAVAVFWGNGTAALGSPTILPAVIPDRPGFTGAGPTEVGDVDGDGHLDIVAVSCTTSSPIVTELIFLRGDGARGFAPAAQRDWPDDACSGSMSLANFDGDGFADVLQAVNVRDGTGEVVERRAFVRFGDPAAALTESKFVAGAGPGTTVADVDADGRPDLLTPTDDGLRVFMNRWSGRP